MTAFVQFAISLRVVGQHALNVPGLQLRKMAVEREYYPPVTAQRLQIHVDGLSPCGRTEVTTARTARLGKGSACDRDLIGRGILMALPQANQTGRAVFTRPKPKRSECFGRFIAVCKPAVFKQERLKADHPRRMMA